MEMGRLGGSRAGKDRHYILVFPCLRCRALFVFGCRRSYSSRIYIIAPILSHLLSHATSIHLRFVDTCRLYSSKLRLDASPSLWAISLTKCRVQ